MPYSMSPFSWSAAVPFGSAGTVFRAARAMIHRFDAVAIRVSNGPGSGSALKLICVAAMNASATIRSKKMATLTTRVRIGENTSSS
jgi:hypothetical protein